MPCEFQQTPHTAGQISTRGVDSSKHHTQLDRSVHVVWIPANTTHSWTDQYTRCGFQQTPHTAGQISTRHVSSSKHHTQLGRSVHAVWIPANNTHGWTDQDMLYHLCEFQQTPHTTGQINTCCTTCVSSSKHHTQLDRSIHAVQPV